VLTGLSANDSYDTVLASSNAIISGFKTVLGANTFRIPINETTVNTATTWAAYKGIFDAAISQNVKVIVAYWLPPGSNHVADTTTWNTMWKTVVDAYVSSDLVYFDVFNEPSGYSATAFVTLVQQWMTANPSVPANRVIVAGTTTDIDVNQQGPPCPTASSRFTFMIASGTPWQLRRPPSKRTLAPTTTGPSSLNTSAPVSSCRALRLR